MKPWGTTSADVTADAKLVGEGRPPGFAKYNATSESEPELAESSGDDDDAGSSWSRANSTTSADVTAVAKTVGEFRPPGIAKFSASTESEFTKSSDEAGSSRFKANDTNSAAVTAVVKSAAEARPASRQNPNPNSQSLLVRILLPMKMKLDLLGPKQAARPAHPQQQQSQSLWVKFGFLGSQCALSSEAVSCGVRKKKSKSESESGGERK